MDTQLECMSCFKKMAIREARMACPDDDAMQARVIQAWDEHLREVDMTQPPPLIARNLSSMVREITGCGDLYKEDKREANTFVASLLPSLVDRITERRKKGGDVLGLTLELSIIGNYIDRGVEIEFDLEKELAHVADTVSAGTLDALKKACRPDARVLILGDNNGEIVLDTLLVRELVSCGCDVTYAVRSRPVLNDATMEDARAVGMTDLCRVVESGVDTPGTVLECCTDEFLERMRGAHVILSKGQGNFEALEGRWPGIFCAFKVKCPHMSRRTGLKMGASALCLSTLDGVAGS